MRELQTSMYRLYSMGIVAANKEIGSHTARVTPIELTNMSDGELDDVDRTLSGSGVDGLGQNFVVEVNASTAISCQWLPFSSNRVTPPDLRRGERVFIWQFADENKWWWTTTGLDEHLRRLETVVFAVSNESDPEKDIDKLTPDNSYYVEFNTHTKHITLATNKNDNEPFAFTFQFNTKNGIVTLADDDNNFFEFNSRDVIMTFQNKFNTVVQLDNETINLFSNKDINLRTDTMNVTATTINYTAKTINTKATDIITEATNINTQATTITTTCTNQNITGITAHTGNFSVTGALAVAGPFTMAPGAGGSDTATFSAPVSFGSSSSPVEVNIYGTFKVNDVDVGELHEHGGDGGTGSGDSTGPVKVV